jgi:hypothetical protein
MVVIHTMYLFLNLMKENGIEVVCLPPHTTHVMQPADKALFKAAKSHWEEAGRKFVRESGGRRLTKSEFFFQVFTPVWKTCTTVEICQNGFRATGLFPCNRNAIPEVAFAPSLTTDREQALVTMGTAVDSYQPDAVASTSNQTATPEVTVESVVSVSANHDADVTIGCEQGESSTSIFQAGNDVIEDSIADRGPESGMTADAPQSLYDICKAPTRERPALKIVRRKPPSSNLTSDAHFTFLSEKKLKTTAPVARLSRVKQADKAEKTKNKTGERKNCLRSLKDNKETKCRNKKKVGWFCCLCQEDRQADMRQCLGCSRWMHDECLGVDKKDKGTYPCQECMS